MKITSFNVKGKNNSVKITLTGKNPKYFWEELEGYIKQNEKFFKGASLLIDGLPLDFDETPAKGLEELYNVSIKLTGKTTKTLQNHLVATNSTYYHLKTIRSGQRFFYAGDVVVFGNVNSGGEILASGNITVTNSIGGLVHAGYNGDKKSFVIAEKLLSPQIRIADHVLPVEKASESAINEKVVVSIAEKDIVVNEFNDVNMKGD
ncbi:septum site-determining protein MinC [Proteinivorax hydrogeniformans]|uniref:Probable septum site-determining protein MinC n=1 Tax=Proteinivorax hydrogeniformans TaxID=1826727 RepID=A0AAU8HWN2_9FIRM